MVGWISMLNEPGDDYEEEEDSVNIEDNVEKIKTKCARLIEENREWEKENVKLAKQVEGSLFREYELKLVIKHFQKALTDKMVEHCKLEIKYENLCAEDAGSHVEEEDY